MNDTTALPTASQEEAVTGDIESRPVFHLQGIGWLMCATNLDRKKISTVQRH